MNAKGHKSTHPISVHSRFYISAPTTSLRLRRPGNLLPPVVTAHYCIFNLRSIRFPLRDTLTGNCWPGVVFCKT